MMLRTGGNRLLGLGFVRQVAATPAAAATATRSYHERVVDHYNNPRNVGAFDKDDPTVGTALVGAPACGDVMKFQIKVDENTEDIVDSCFKTFGCGSAIASSSVATEWVKGKQIDEVLSIKNTLAINSATTGEVIVERTFSRGEQRLDSKTNIYLYKSSRELEEIFLEKFVQRTEFCTS